jgi:hypothetical protein
MIGGLLALIFSVLFAFYWIERLKSKYPTTLPASLMKKIFFFHLVMTVAYYGYVTFNPSDSRFYYQKILMDYRGENWFDFYGTSTRFIEFLAYPMVKFLGFSYEAMMVLFSLVGFLGFLYLYIFFQENIKFKHTLFGVNFLTLFFFLPNVHFWSASLGKGAVVFFGIALFFYGISRLKHRVLAVLLGSIIIYHVRPHIMFVILLSSAIGFMFSARNVSMSWRLLFLAGAAVGFFFIYRDVLALVGFDDENVIGQGLDLTHRVNELAKATSGVDITGYSLPLQVFTFLYRPLFFDAPGLLGIIVSFENVFYLLITLKLLLSVKGLKYLFFGTFLTKSALLSFLTVSIALAQISGNLGLAIRQKSQVMLLLMFVIISFLDEEKIRAWHKAQRSKAKRRVSTQPQPVAT